MANQPVLRYGTCGLMVQPADRNERGHLRVRYSEPLPATDYYRVTLSPLWPGMRVDAVDHEGFTLVMPDPIPGFQAVYVVRHALMT